jgi:hypothetical protein
MGFLEKSKVTLTLLCETDHYAPGSTVTGTLQVEVHKLVTFTALRIRLRGKEHFYVERRDMNNNPTFDHRYFNHVTQTQTLLGAPAGSKSSGATQLEPGQYTYPFSLYIPPQAPPSFRRCRREYGCTVVYTLKGYLEIPLGFDAKVKFPLTVTQTVSVSQLQPARQNVTELPLSEACVAQCNFCGCCFCCVDKDSFIRTEAAVAPTILVLNSSVQLPSVTAVPQQTKSAGASDGAEVWPPPIPVADDPAVIVIFLRVTNYTKNKSPSRCVVSLVQRHLFSQDSCCFYNDRFLLCAAEVHFPTGPLNFGEATTVQVPLRVGITSDLLPAGERFMPCLNLKYFVTTTELEVTFPEVAAEGTMHLMGKITLADDVDMTNQSVEMPYDYSVNLCVDGDEDAAPASPADSL